MSDVDLVPGVFRKRLLFNHWLKQWGIALAVLTLLVLGAFAWLREETERVDLQLKQLQSQKAISTQQRSDLEKLNSRKKDLKQQLDLLAGLRSGVAAEQIFTTIDRALASGDVWFTNWRFRRAGTPAEKTRNEVSTGYFVVIPNGKNSREETWKIETHMTIDGGALDHAALSHFVSSLIEQPEIKSVRVVRSELARHNRNKLVEFSLEVVVSAGGSTG